MTEQSGFDFEVRMVPADERDELTPAPASDASSVDSGGTSTTSPAVGTGNGVVTTLQKKYDPATNAETTSQETGLLTLGLALYTYEVSSLSALLDCADADPDPPQYVEAILPFVRRFVERHGF